MVFCNTDNKVIIDKKHKSHNPYFNRWFSAMIKILKGIMYLTLVTILILIDGFLQYKNINTFKHTDKSQSLF